MVDIRQLAVVRTVVQTSSVSEAARLLHISQPAVSKTVKLVERELDVVLFQRVNGRLIPTPQARTLVPDFDRLISDLGIIKQTARELRDGRQGQVKIAAAPAITTSLLPPALGAFRTANPAVQFAVTAAPTRTVVELVARRLVDFGISQPSSGDPSVEAVELCKGTVVCLMPSRHPLARLRRVRPSDLASHELISFTLTEPTGARISEAFRAEGLRFRVAVDVNQSITALALVRAGLGVALVDSFLLVGRSFPGVVSRPFEPAISIGVQLMTSRQSPPSPLAQAFRQELSCVATRWSA